MIIFFLKNFRHLESMRYAVHVFSRHFGVLESAGEKLCLSAAFREEQPLASLAARIGLFRRSKRHLEEKGKGGSKEFVLSYFPVHSKL